MSIKTPREDSPDRVRIITEAAEWLVQIDDPGCSEDQYGQWRAWVEQNPAHERAFDDVVACSARLGELREELAEIRLPTDGELASDNYDATVSVEQWSAQQPRKRKDRQPYLVAAALTAVAFGLVVYAITEMAGPFDGSQPHRFATVESQHQEAQLEDGSIIEIGADSALTVSYSREQRTVVLEEGEALFHVASDVNRPFVVVAGTGTITAIGTEFNIRRDSDRVVVTVVEGSVTVRQQSETMHGGHANIGNEIDVSRPATARLEIGQQVSYDAAGLTGAVVTDPDVVTSWQQGRLQYLREPLRFVITGVNRYSDTKIVIADTELENLLFTGTVFDGQTDEWLEGLANILPVEVNYIGDSTVILRKAK